jgi:hypothetical protein
MDRLIGSPAGLFARPVRARGAWAPWWPRWYRLIRLMDGLLRPLVKRLGYANLVLMRVPGRRSGKERQVLLGELRVGERRYLGHPNGDTDWTLNVRAADHITLERANRPRARFRPVVLGPGPERDAVLSATYQQHPFPGNAFYRLAAGHVRAYGVYFRLEPISEESRQMRQMAK